MGKEQMQTITNSFIYSNFKYCKLRVAILKKLNLRVASSFLRVSNLKKNFTSCKLCFVSWKLRSFFSELPVAFYELKVKDDKLTSWKFKMIIFTSCEVVFYKLNIWDANFKNHHHMLKSNFKGLNLRKLCEKTILIKCTLTLDNSNTH